jgi:hypothetical protein
MMFCLSIPKLNQHKLSLINYINYICPKLNVEDFADFLCKGNAEDF